MSFRRLLLVCGLTLADYLLWNWSLSGNHTVLALVSGLTLPFLLLASTVLLALSLARVVSGSVRRSQQQVSSQQQARGPGSAVGQSDRQRARRPGTAAGLLRRRGRPTSGSAPSAPSSPASSARQRAA
jgi:hypothetical protein